MISLFGGNKFLELKWWTFPAGERNVKIMDVHEIEKFKSFTIFCNYTGSNDLIDLLLLVNAIRNVSRTTRLRLVIPYFPAARQDRVMTPGEPFALQVMADLIKAGDFAEVETWDVHSDVLAGMFEPGVLQVKPQEELWKNHVNCMIEGKHLHLVSPDAGALKKIYKLAKLTNLPVIEAGKIRDVTTGAILRTHVERCDVPENSTFVVVDDICDGGRTFIELAAAIRSTYDERQVGRLVLCVTHGIFSNGLAPLQVFDQVLTVNNMSDHDLDAFNNRNLS